jgi:hypothetical protein
MSTLTALWLVLFQLATPPAVQESTCAAVAVSVVAATSADGMEGVSVPASTPGSPSASEAASATKPEGDSAHARALAAVRIRIGLPAPLNLTDEVRRPLRATPVVQLPPATDGRDASRERISSETEPYHIAAARIRGQRLVVRRTSHVAVAMGGRLPYFATAPPSHG